MSVLRLVENRNPNPVIEEFEILLDCMRRHDYESVEQWLTGAIKLLERSRDEKRPEDDPDFFSKKCPDGLDS